MATAAASGIIRLKGRLCIGPTDLTTAFPHGGTAIGMTRDGVFMPNYKATLNTAEEWGGVVSKVYYTGERPYLAAILRDYDNDALSTVFPNTSAGTVSQDRLITFSPGNDSANRPGYDLTGKQVKLCFSPSNPVRHPFIVLYYAIPAIQETAEFRLTFREELGIGVVFHAGVDSSDRCYAIGKSDDITL